MWPTNGSICYLTVRTLFLTFLTRRFMHEVISLKKTQPKRAFLKNNDWKRTPNTHASRSRDISFMRCVIKVCAATISWILFVVQRACTMMSYRRRILDRKKKHGDRLLHAAGSLGLSHCVSDARPCWINRRADRPVLTGRCLIRRLNMHACSNYCGKCP